MNKYAMIAFALSQALTFGQETPRPSPATDKVTKVIHVRYARAEAIRDVVELGGAHCRADNGLKVLVLYGTASEVTDAEQAVKEVDVPALSELARNVEITVYVIGATSKGAPASTPAAEIEPVLRQLKSVFPYGSYQLLASTIIRSREGRSAASSGLLKNFPDAQTAFLNTYKVNCDLDSRPMTGNDRTIRFNKFSFSTGVPNSDDRVSVETNFDVQNEQKVVVGNTNIDSGNSALFLVVSAKIVQ